MESFISTWFLAIILVQIALTIFIAWGIMHEEKFIEFENRVWHSFCKLWRKYNPLRLLIIFILAIRLEIAERKESKNEQ